MRILHVVPTYFPAVRYGGPIYSVHALGRALVARGHDVHVYTTNVDGSGISNVSLIDPAVINGVTVSYFPCATGRRLYRSPKMAEALARHLRSFDVAHLHSVFLWPTLAAARAARRLGTPYILAPRGMLVRELIDRKNCLAKRAWIRMFERANVAGAAAVHVTSELEKEELAKLGIQARRVAVIANGIDLPPPQSALASNAFKKPCYVLALGRINWKKGLERLIRAMTRVPQADLIIAGNDEEDHKQELQNVVYELGLADRVHFFGPVYGEEKWRLMRSASVFALPSYSENFGVAVLEALSCGCPVVITPEVGLAHAVAEAQAGIVVSGDPRQIGDAIASLILDPARRERMGEAGLRLATKEYSWAMIADQMEQLYESCVLKTKKHAA